MAALNYNDTVSLFNNLKQSIDEFYVLNQHLENSGVFSMSKILRNCLKMDHFLNSNFESLWKMEHDDLRELREKLQSIPVEIIKHNDNDSDDDLDDDSYCDMPPLIPVETNDITEINYDDMPPLIPLSSVFSSQNGLNEEDMSSVYSVCTLDKAVLSPSRPQTPVNIPYTFRQSTPPTVLRSSMWGWPPVYNSMSALSFNQEVRDL